MLYHDQSFESQVTGVGSYKYKRESISITLAVLLCARVVAEVSTGVVALVEGSKQINQLDAAIKEDLKEIETSVRALKDSLISLSEVVLQNRRGPKPSL